MIEFIASFAAGAATVIVPLILLEVLDRPRGRREKPAKYSPLPPRPPEADWCKIGDPDATKFENVGLTFEEVQEFNRKRKR